MFDLQNILKMRFSKITAGNPVVLTTVNFPSNLAFSYRLVEILFLQNTDYRHKTSFNYMI